MYVLVTSVLLFCETSLNPTQRKIINLYCLVETINFLYSYPNSTIKNIVTLINN